MLLATILGSGLAGIDATVVNVALPAIGADLHADFAALQWTINAYTLTLASLILLGGALGDRYGRRRVFVIGVVWFAVASLLCGLAPTAPLLIAARALQGVGGALLTPGSLAIIQASFAPQDRARAIGAWSGLGGIGDRDRAVPRRLADRGRVAGAGSSSSTLPLARRRRARRRSGTSRRPATRTATGAHRPARGRARRGRPGRASPTRSSRRRSGPGSPVVVAAAVVGVAGDGRLRARRVARARTRCCRWRCSARASSPPPTW